MQQLLFHLVETMGQEQKGEEASSSSGIYTYKHRDDKGVDTHEIFLKRSRARVLLSYAGVVFLLAIVCQSFLGKVHFC
jgi:phosphatidylinositol glycan class H protein